MSYACLTKSGIKNEELKIMPVYRREELSLPDEVTPE